jgi:hypothetical protein
VLGVSICTDGESAFFGTRVMGAKQKITAKGKTLKFQQSTIITIA